MKVKGLIIAPEEVYSKLGENLETGVITVINPYAAHNSYEMFCLTGLKKDVLQYICNMSQSRIDNL